MRNALHFFAISLISLLFFRCTIVNHHPNIKNDEFALVEKLEQEAEDEDGIRAAQEMEFDRTKDIRLGYVPKDRLIKATNELYQSKKDNSVAYRADALAWTERGPFLDTKGAQGNSRGSVGTPTLSGRIISILVDLSDAINKTVWVGSASGGLWKTINVAATPATWTPVNDFFANLSVSSICQDPTSKSILYFGTGEKTFNSDRMRGGGIWKSTDGGLTWNFLASTAGLSNVSKIVCDVSGNLYVSTIGNGVLRSSNGGTSWTNITPTGVSLSVVEMNLSSTGRLHIVFGYSDNATPGYRYTTSPATVTPGSWTSATTVFSNTNYNTTLASKGDTLYSLPANSADQTDQVWKSVDGGNNWLTTSTTPPITGTSPLSSKQAWYCIAMAVDPSNSNNVMVGGLNSYHTTDGGSTWSVNSVWSTSGSTPSYMHADHHTYVWSSGNQLLCGTDGGISYSSDGGNTFTDRNQGLRIKQFYSCAMHPTLPNYFLAGAQDNGTHQLNGTGLTSSLEVVGGDGGFVHIDQNEPNYQFGSYTNNQYRLSTDGANSFNSVNFSSTIGAFINPTDYDDINNNFYGAWSAGNYVRWLNAPLSTAYSPTAISAFAGGTVTHVHMSHAVSNRAFFGIDNGKIIITNNTNTASPTATDITGSTMSASTVSCIAFGTDENNLLATFSNYGSKHVWLSNTGGGATGWTDITGNLPDIPVRWAMFSPDDNTKAILATEMGIYETSLINGASTVWVPNSSFPVVRTDMLDYRSSDNTILAATHGRGLWSSIISPAAPYIRFLPTSNYSPLNIMTTTGSDGTCRNYTDQTLAMHIDQAPTGAAVVNLTIAGGGTATQGKDFDFTTNGSFTSPSASLNFGNGVAADQPITIRVYNQAKISGNLFFTFNYTVSGSTNALPAPTSKSYTINIGDNTVAPVASTYSGTYIIGASNTTIAAESPFRGDLSKNRVQYLFLASELTAAGISTAGNIGSMQISVATKYSSLPYTGFTIAMANTTATSMGAGFPSAKLTQVFSANYSTVVGNNLFTFTTPFAWDGISNVIVNMCFDNGASTSSYDIVSATATPFGTGIRGTSWSVVGTGSGCSLPATYVSDARVAATFSAYNGNSIETGLNNNRSENITDNAQYYILNGYNVINSLNGATAALGCVNSSIVVAGNTWSTFQTGQASQKLIQITPTTNVSTAAYTVGLYFTLAELGGKTASGLRIAKTTAASMATANSTNTVLSTTTVTAFGTGYIFTANFTGFSKFFLVDNNVVLPVELVSFNGLLNNDEHALLNWRTTNQYNLRNFEVQRSYDGIQFINVGNVDAIQMSGTVLDYNFADATIAHPINFYRLKMIDMDGRFKMSTVLNISNVKLLKFVTLMENPVKDQIGILINNLDKEKIDAQLFNSAGQLIRHWELGKVNGAVSLPFNNNKPPAGLYTIRISTVDKLNNLKISIQ